MKIFHEEIEFFDIKIIDSNSRKQTQQKHPRKVHLKKKSYESINFIRLTRPPPIEISFSNRQTDRHRSPGTRCTARSKIKVASFPKKALEIADPPDPAVVIDVYHVDPSPGIEETFRETGSFVSTFVKFRAWKNRYVACTGEIARAIGMWRKLGVEERERDSLKLPVSTETSLSEG